MSIRTKIPTGLGLVLVFFVVQAGAVWFFANQTRAKVISTVMKNTVANEKLEKIALLAQQLRRYEMEYFIHVDNAKLRAKHKKEWTDAYGALEGRLSALEANEHRSFGTRDLSEVAVWRGTAEFYGDEMRKVFRGVDIHVATVAQQGATAVAPLTPAEVNGQIRSGKEQFAVLIDGVNKLSAVKLEDTLKLSDYADGAFQTLFYIVSASVLLGSLIALSLLVTLPNSVTRPIESLASAAEAMSKGKLNAQFSALGVAEFRKLAEALERMRAAQLAFLERLRARNAS
jgi:HAMP domain-containing protein